ncbi:hypothetical protein ACIF6I_15895 [Streptomyces microflavus]|uniref:hypothetical protein n=1 Tax=Streptomyces microflavus TaxID=1919 RepID=UPI003427F6A8
MSVASAHPQAGPDRQGAQLVLRAEYRAEQAERDGRPDGEARCQVGEFVQPLVRLLAFRRYFGETPGAYVERTATRTAA